MPYRNVPAPLPVWEQCLYWTTESLTILYMFSSLYHASEDAQRQNEPIYIDDGWAVIGRPMDTADYEWSLWSSCVWNMFPWVCGHVLLSCSISRCISSLKIKAALSALYGLLGACYLLSFRTVVVLSVLPVALYLVAKLGSAKAVWLAALLFLTIVNVWENAISQWAHGYNHSTDGEVWSYLSILTWGALFQRSTSFALECVWVQQSQSAPASSAEEAVSQTTINTISAKSAHPPAPSPLAEEPTWLDLFFYVFYFPLFFTGGPLITYNKFHRQFREPHAWTWKKLVGCMGKLLRILFWAVLLCVALHFIYPYAISRNETLLAQQSRVTVAAIGYSLGQLFMVKYVVLFGIPAQMAHLDGFEAPAVPACISYIYCYSDMWRSFDRGLYDFMTRYIFIPVGGSQAGLGLRVMGSVLCFAFVFYWHGAEYYLFLWCVLNFMETSLEQIGAWVENTEVVRNHVYGRMSPAAVRRVRAVMSVPMFLLSVFAIFYFFSGTESGIVFLRKLLLDNPWDYFGVFLLLVYCAVQNAMEVERLGLTKLRVSKRRD